MKEKINIKKLKRHKKPLICLFLIVIAVILFAVIISNGRKRNEKQQTMYQEEQNQLTDMTGYLDEIDDTVTANRERLAENIQQRGVTVSRQCREIHHYKEDRQF